MGEYNQRAFALPQGKGGSREARYVWRKEVSWVSRAENGKQFLFFQDAVKTASAVTSARFVGAIVKKECNINYA